MVNNLAKFKYKSRQLQDLSPSTILLFVGENMLDLVPNSRERIKRVFDQREVKLTDWRFIEVKHLRAI